MQKLRSLHLYLGCIFAPLLLFFAVSGIWQTFGLHSALLDRLSTIHTSHQLKNGSSLSSLAMLSFIVIMAVSFIITTLLGVMMALKFGRSRRTSILCLAVGIVVPLLFILARAFR